MRVGRRPQKLTSYRAMLERRGDVELNAHARHWRRNALGVALGLALIGGAAALYQGLRPHEEVPTNPREFQDKVRCSDCGHEAIIRVKTRERFPLTCPKCGVRSCWKVWRCRDCGTEFAYKPGRDEQATAAVTVSCPHCGGLSVGSAVEPVTTPGSDNN